jgi:hypothetical protein
MFRFSGEKPNPLGADGRLSFPNIYGDQGAPRCAERPQPPRGGEGADRTFEGRASALLSKDATDEQKLATVREMAKAGITGLTFKDASGQEHKLRLELEAAGNRQMVHLFVSGADGKEHTALRGISRADGSFEHERDRSGHFVGFEGRGYSELSGSQQPNDDRTAPPDRFARPDAVRPQQRPWSGPDVQDGSVDRSQFDSQMRDPRVLAAFAGRMHSEVGNQGPAAQLAFAEEVFNRAASRGQTLMQALSGGYYPTRNPGYSHNPHYLAAITTAYQQGTDTIHGATGNSSGHVGFGVRGGHYDGNHRWVSPNQVAQIGGERFGYEQADLSRGWMNKYHELKARGSIASRERTRQAPIDNTTRPQLLDI